MFYGSGVLCKGMANRREKSLASKAQIQQALHCRMTLPQTSQVEDLVSGA